MKRTTIPSAAEIARNRARSASGLLPEPSDVQRAACADRARAAHQEEALRDLIPYARVEVTFARRAPRRDGTSRHALGAFINGRAYFASGDSLIQVAQDVAKKYRDGQANPATATPRIAPLTVNH